jgi:gliding motility-associated-like protein
VNNVESNRTAIKVVVTNQNCATPCYTSKPVLGSNQIFNNCPATTADLTTVSASNQPVGAIVTWHTALPATASNKIVNPTAVAAGAYYAVFFNAATGCFADSGRAGTSILVTITDCSKCNAGSTSPKLNTTGISNTCPATTADLTKVTASNQPSGTVLQWHTSLPITANNKVANPSQVTAGIYYAVYFDATNNCFSNNGQGYTPILVTITTCPNPCNAGTTAPNISNDVLSNLCPATTVNLNSVTATNTPANTSISWHTGLPATASNKVNNPNSVLAGIYFAVFFDATNNCYSGAGYGSKPVVVTISNCPDPCNAGKIAPVLSADSALNVCPATTVNLNAITSNNTPSGTTLQWHTSLPATAGNKVTNTAAVVAGTYYAVFYDATNNCYSNQGFGAKQFIASATNCGPACTAGNFSPNVDKNVIANVCPATTVNLNTITASNQPKNTILSWHTSIPATASNKIANPQAYGSQGTVYAVFYDSKNDCYNQGGNSGTEVTVVITSCPNPCKGGTENPKLSATDITNICPATTSNLSTVTASNLPSGAVLEWHTGLPITASNKLSNITNVNSGIYYAVFFDATNNCYSNNGLSATQVLVANTSCPKCLVPSTAPEIPTATIATICPATTADLNTVIIINKPRGVVVKWYTAAAVSNATVVSNPSAVVAGTYYATFYDTANNCFANSGNGNFTSVTVTLTKCCNAGNEAPKFNLTTLTNICPATTVDLTAVKAINQPTNLVLEWHTATPVSASTKVKDISKVNAGTYYAVFYDATNNCYASNGQMTTPFTVSTKTCTTCNAGNSSPDLSTSAISNACPATTVDLSKVSASNQPAGTVLEWHITTPASKNTKVDDISKVGAGTYYAIFYDPTNTCYANNGVATTKIDVVIRNCNTPCNAGEVAPKLNTNAVSNTCPSTTADLTNVLASNLPSGAVLQWHTASPSTAANKVANASQVGAGTYYAVFYDATNNCYSAVGNGTTPVTVVIGNCTNPSKCDTFKSSPTLLKDTTVNSCPSLTANLSNLASTVSVGTIVTWHTATPASDANRISNSTSVGAGTYYAVLYDTASKCYAMKGYATKKVTVTINNCPVCNSGNEAPIVDKQSLMNNCPMVTADLTSIKVSNLPKNTILTWHTATPATDANKVSNPSAISIVGAYYAAFYDPINGCYSGAGKSTFPVQVDIVNCNTTCASGNTAPQLGATALKNTCPAATADLTTISAANKPASSSVIMTWHTAIPTSEFNKVSNPSAVISGTYYAVFYDVVNKCYAGNGKATTTVIVSIDNCSPKCNAGNAQPFFGTDSLLNKCPLTTANLLTLIAQNQPKGTVVEWRNASGSIVANPSAVTAGSYTAYFKDTINNCYSSGNPNAVQVKIVSCLANGPNNDYVQFDSRSKGPKEIQTATNDTKTSGSKYSITPNGNPKKGTATIDPVTGKVTYTITDTSFVGYDTITYQLCDTITNQCSTAYVIISLSHPKDTTVDNNSDANTPLIIDGDKISGVPAKPAGANQQYDITVNPSNGTATIDPTTGKITYLRNANACGKDSIQVTRTYSFTDGRPTEKYTYWVYVYNTCANEDAFPNYITPNGDGKNDKFVIPDSYLKKYPGAKLIIYNRWGNVVWRSVGAYQNDWAGTHYDNDNLPDGVYYYLIELKDNFGEIKNGFIQIMRD